MSEKIEKAKDGKILLDNDDMQKIIEAAREQEEEQAAPNRSRRVNGNRKSISVNQKK